MNQMYDYGPNKNYAFALLLLVSFVVALAGIGYGLYRLIM